MTSSAKSGAVLGAFVTLMLAGCGGGEDSTTAEKLSSQQEVEQIANDWAPLFAAGDDRAACVYETQPVCERIACEHVGNVPIKNCTPPSEGFRGSFKDATVEEVAIKGHRAAARFANGEVVELAGGGEYQPDPAWLIEKFGGSAGQGFFE